MKTKIFISLLSVMQFFLSSGFAATLYVSPTGSNTAPYGTLATAANEIKTAVNASLAGDLILVDDGTYILSTYINIVKGITVQSIHGPTLAIVDGNHLTKCFLLDHPDAVVDGFTIRNGYHPAGFGGGVNIQDGGTVKNCILYNNQARDGGGIAIDNLGLVQNCHIYNNLASDNGSSGYGGGIRLLNGGTARNCLVTGNTSKNYGGGINIWTAGTVENCVVSNNTAPNGAGIRTRKNGLVYNTILYFNNGLNHQVDGSGYHYYNCCTTPALPSAYSTNCISADPLFISTTPGLEDYHLQTGSPCIDAGMNLGWMGTIPDLDGNNRIQNGIVDISCFEKSPAPADTDGDGVPDVDDDYPLDPDRAFNNYYPASGYGTLAFEDLWPGKGDYDFNDLVCDYRFQTVTNASNMVVEVFSTFIIKAFGATLHNGFGYQLSGAINPAHLSVTGYSLTSGYINLSANGTEAGQTKPTIIVFDDAYDQMTYPGNGIGVNTEPTAPYVTPVTLSVAITFAPGTYSYTDLDIADFNPFIIVNKNRGVEVHLPDHLPTDLVNPALFGTSNDDTNPALGKYYKTVDNLPWAINIYESFDYPKEKADITHTYNHFAEWAESNGTLFPDWYHDDPGYRNDSNIY